MCIRDRSRTKAADVAPGWARPAVMPKRIEFHVAGGSSMCGAVLALHVGTVWLLHSVRDCQPGPQRLREGRVV
eukprot:6805544-Alexandrium_andersonii.AAC.1